MSKVTHSNKRGIVSQKNHHSRQFRGSQSQVHRSSKPFLGIKEGGIQTTPLPPPKKSTTASFL